MNIQLSDERIDAMRDHVLSAVDGDLKQRGRRARKAVVGGIGALALVTVLGVSFPSFTGQGSGPDVMTAQQADDGGTSAALPEPEVAAEGPAGAGYDAAQRLDADAKAMPEGGDISPIPPDEPPLTAPGKDREVIATGSAIVTVRDTAKAATRFTAWVQAHGGRVDARSESRDDEGNTSAHVVARIPSKHVQAAVAELRKTGEIESVDLQRADVTAQGADLDGRIKALKISIERLENILERAGSSSEVIEAETALSQRQQELESLQLQRRSLTDQVALSTISVSFEQKEGKPGAVTPGGFRGGLIAGWNALVDTVNAIVTAAGAAVPWLGIGLVAGLGWWLVRRARRR